MCTLIKCLGVYLSLAQNLTGQYGFSVVMMSRTCFHTLPNFLPRSGKYVD